MTCFLLSSRGSETNVISYATKGAKLDPRFHGDNRVRSAEDGKKTAVFILLPALF
jgi:hypothetical protein